VSQNTAGGGCSAGSHAVEWPDILGGGDHDDAVEKPPDRVQLG
jgi:hypothetical protein